MFTEMPCGLVICSKCSNTVVVLVRTSMVTDASVCMDLKSLRAEMAI